jgi:predicted secreted protein
MQANVKRGFNRLFAVLTAVWIVYCLVVYPIQRRAQAEKVVVHPAKLDSWGHV